MEHETETRVSWKNMGPLDTRGKANGMRRRTQSVRRQGLRLTAGTTARLAEWPPWPGDVPGATWRLPWENVEKEQVSVARGSWFNLC